MSYLRWLHSNWYVFWKTSNALKADDELLAIWYAGAEELPFLTFRELKGIKSIKSLKKIMRKFFTKEEFKKINEKDWEELWLAVKEWIRDVKEKYKEETINYCSEKECPFWKNKKCLYNNGCLIIDINEGRFNNVRKNFEKLKK